MEKHSDFRIVTAELDAHFDAIRAVRIAVFVEEQAIPSELEFDRLDAHCIHVLALDGETPVATGRLGPGQNGRIGRVAVLKSHRRRGVGTAIMKALEDHAARQGIKKTWFHAQVAAVPFYESLGYQVAGEVFEEAGIPHVSMEKPIG